MPNLIVLLLAAFVLAPQCLADETHWLPVHGKVVIAEGTTLSTAEVTLQLESGRQLLAFPLADGSFSFPEVPLGVHTLSVQVQGLLYPTIRVDVGAARKGKVSSTVADVPGAPALTYPLLLRPLTRLEYFEKRQGFNLWAFIKTPYGLMGCFMVFSMFILPRLKIDPEEYKEMVGGAESSDAPAIAAGSPAQTQTQGVRRRSD
ncbi:hypothetical protein D9Q98_008278 [Chlorella vulgaris]|uniref:ER membrane protein complex subunit 7 beta-sandwich domain-containing protein n=1 Tax=Chlorella vulgaris TaxID=3077 RepID=A0A9D4TGC2_CHLVU|nr:hypothetical protein D9Q98_008278 [Chlorella vulgaris]